MSSIGENLERVWEQMSAAAVRAGRAAEEVTLVGVTKTHPPETILEALAAGLQHIGENRVEELEAKRVSVEARLRQDPEQVRPPGALAPVWHMVGHVQSRKAVRVVSSADLVHSVDSLKLARRLDRFAAEQGCVLPILLEVNLSGESSKFGWHARDWRSNDDQWNALRDWVTAVVELPCLDLQGLMTMAPWVADPEDVRPIFRSARLLRERLAAEIPSANWRHLSMGMTDDFKVAIEEGATLIRVGRAIFGSRQAA